MNVIIDGIRINRITEITCNVDTDYVTEIHFQIDDRIDGITNPDDIKSFKVKKFLFDDQDIDFAVIMIPNDKDITSVITRDNKS